MGMCACVHVFVSVIRWENTTSSIIICTLHKPILQGDRATAVGNMRLFGEVWTYDSRDMLTGRHTDSHTCSSQYSARRTTHVSRYQKGKTNLDFTEARESEGQWHQLGHMQVCTSLQRDNHPSTPHHSVFYWPGALPAAQPTASKH